MGLLDDLANVIFNSKQGNELPISESALDTDWFIFFNNNSDRMERILKSKFTGNQSINSEFLGSPITAGVDTTDQEVEDHLNATGFNIGSNEIKVINLNVLVNAVVNTRLYFYMPNLEGIYGTGNTVISFVDLLIIEEKVFDQNTATTTVIPLGDIGASTIEDYINANNDPAFDLQADIIYIFTATISSVDKEYLYVGVQPLLIGSGNNAVTSDDFVELGTADGVIPLIVIAGFNFELWKNPDNNNPANVKILEATDIIKGFTSNVKYMEAVYLGGDQTDFNNLAVYNRYAGTTL